MLRAASRSSVLVALLPLALCGHAGTARAWSRDPLSPTPIMPTASGDQNVITAFPDGSGGCYVLSYLNISGVIRPVLQRLTATGALAAGWSTSGLLVNSSTTPTPLYMCATADGTGGAYVAWTDSRTGHQGVYAQHVLSNGTLAVGWATNGNAVYTSSVDEKELSLCNDGAGGLLIAFTHSFSGADHDIYASHVSSAGSASTISIAVTGLDQDRPVIASDGAGGAFIAYEQVTGVGNTDIKVAHIEGSPLFLTLLLDITVCNTANNQTVPDIASDGANGAYVQWFDYNVAGGPHPTISHLGTTGAPEPYYGTAGSPYTNGGNTAFESHIASDGGGGAVLLWNYTLVNSALYGMRAMPHGAFASGWSPLGDVITSVSTNHIYPRICGDGNGGAFMVWFDDPWMTNLFATHWLASGTSAPSIPVNGREVGLQPDFFYTPAVCPDAAGGAFYFFSAFNGTNFQAKGIHLDRYAMLGDNRPTSAGVRDIASDQGGQVRFTWNASPYDNDSELGIGSYWVWRQAPLALAQAAVAAGARWADAEDVATAVTPVKGRLFRRDASLATNYAWEFLTSMPAHQATQYSFVAGTTTDSVAGHNPYSLFMVEAHAAGDDRAFWPSPPDSGYSVDNLAPAMPVPFTAQYLGGTTKLHWNPNTETDLSGYRLYRGGSLGFPTDGVHFVTAQPDTGHTDAAGAPYVYKLTAIDIHGNESLAAVVTPSGTVSVEDAAPHELALALVSANPSRDRASFRLALPRAGEARVEVFDAAGRMVRTLTSGSRPPGAWTIEWDGQNEAGRPAASGLYFVRLSAMGRELVRRVVLAR